MRQDRRPRFDQTPREEQSGVDTELPDRRALRGDPTAAPTARCRTASTRQAARRRSSEVRAAAHGGASVRPCLVRHRVVRLSRQVQPAHASCAGPPWSAGALLPVGKAMPWGAGRQRLLDTRSVGREFVLAYPAAERSPTRRPRATRDGPPEGRGPIRWAARREAVPWVHWETRGPSARPLGVATRATSRQTGPTRGPKGLPRRPHLVGSDQSLLDRGVAANGVDG